MNRAADPWPPQEIINSLAAESSIPEWRLRQAFGRRVMQCAAQSAAEAREAYFKVPFGSEEQQSYLVSWDMYSEKNIELAADLCALKKACYGAPQVKITGKFTFEHRAIAVGVRKWVSLAKDFSDLREVFHLAPTKELEDLVIRRMTEMIPKRA